MYDPRNPTHPEIGPKNSVEPQSSGSVAIGGVIDNFQTSRSAFKTDQDPLEAPRAIIRNQVPSNITIEDLFTQTPDQTQQK